MILAVILAYLVLVLAIGLASNRVLRGTGEDFFVATRSIGSFVLLMSLFGTHMTAFSLLGASGEAYHRGIGVFGLMASASAIVVPTVFFFLAPRIWALGKRHGYVTQVEFFRDRWGSHRFGTALFATLTLLLVPYLLIGIKGGGLTLSQVTDGLVPAPLGSVLLCGVVLSYVTFGGLRGTAWANTFQTLVFMVLGAVTFILVLSQNGGMTAAMEKVAAAAPDLLVREGKIRPLELATYACIPLSVGMFPHMFMHWLTAKRASSFRLPIIAYPLCIAVVWVPSVVLGVLGAADFPGLEGPAANSVLVRMIGLYAPGVMAGLLAAGVFAAVMSSLDSQILSLSTLFSRDVWRRRGGDEASQVRSGRLFVVLIFAVTLALSLLVDRSIFKLGVWSFTGFASLLPLPVAALYWRRSNRYGAWASLLVTAGLWIYFLVRSWSEPGYTVGGVGIMPVAVILTASAVAMVVGSLLTAPPGAERVRRFFAEPAKEG